MHSKTYGRNNLLMTKAITDASTVFAKHRKAEQATGQESADSAPEQEEESQNTETGERQDGESTGSEQNTDEEKKDE